MTKVKVGWEGHRLKVAVKPDRENIMSASRPGRGPGARPRRQGAAIGRDRLRRGRRGLAQLSPNESWNLLDAMMGERPLSVLTSTARCRSSASAITAARRCPPAAAAAATSPPHPDRFPPVLLWRGRVKLDARGRAEVDVPLADSLSSYKLVAVATAGGDLFGTGSATIRTVQDLTIYSGLPPLVRSGDEYGATFTLRNGTDKPMNVTASARARAGGARPAPQTVTIPAGGAVPVTWRMTAPEGRQMRWTVTARTADGRLADRSRSTSRSCPRSRSRPGRRPSSGSAPRPSRSLRRPAPCRAAAASTSPDRFAGAGADGVRAYMLAYPYGCFEQRLSKAVALDDRPPGRAQMGDLPTYTDRNGLLRYWPGDHMRGSIALTAYALSITAEAGWNGPRSAGQIARRAEGGRRRPARRRE
jgi:uncharacterized protein YfaS (alpha-2-macroglobulin family)